MTTQTEFNFPKDSFGYVPGAVPAKMIYSAVQPENPIEGLWWVQTSELGAVENIFFYTGTTWLFFGLNSGVVISETEPANPRQGMRWFNLSEPRLYVYYEDVDSGQWVEESTQGIDGSLRADLADVGSLVPIAGVPAKFLVSTFVTPEMFGAVGDGIADDTEALYLAHLSGKNVMSKAGAHYLVKKTNYIPLIDGRWYDYSFSLVTASADCVIADTVGDGFGRYNNSVFYRTATSAMLSSILVINLKIKSLARKVNGIGAPDTSLVRDNHVGWFTVQNYDFASIGEIAGGGGPNTLMDAQCGSAVNIVGYKLNLQTVDIADCGHGVVGFMSKVFRARNVRTKFCGVSRDFTSWYNCASILCRTSETIDIEGCESYVTGGTSYFVSVGSDFNTKYVSIKNCNLVACGLAAVGAGTRSYVATQSKIEVIDIDVNVEGWDCAIGADLHSGMKISIEDLHNSTCDKVKVRGSMDYLAPWESFNNSTLEVDGSYNGNKKKGFSVGSQFGIQCYAVKTGTDNVIGEVDIDVSMRNHQAGGVYVGYCVKASVKGVYENNGWSRQGTNAAWPTLIVSSVYALSNDEVNIDVRINKQCQGVTEEKALCTPVIIRANQVARVSADVTNNGNQLYPLRDIADADGTTLEVARLTIDNPVVSGGFTYLIDNSGGTYSKARKIFYSKDLVALISGSREISPFTSLVKETSAASGVKTVTLLGAKCFDEKVVEVIANATWAVNVSPKSGETIDGSASTVNVPVNTSKRFLSKNGSWITL